MARLKPRPTYAAACSFCLRPTPCQSVTIPTSEEEPMGVTRVWRWLAFTALLGSIAAPAAAQPPSAPAPPVPDCPDLARAIRDMMTNDARLRDWPNLTRYRQANADL